MATETQAAFAFLLSVYEKILTPHQVIRMHARARPWWADVLAIIQVLGESPCRTLAGKGHCSLRLSAIRIVAAGVLTARVAALVTLCRTRALCIVRRRRNGRHTCTLAAAEDTSTAGYGIGLVFLRRATTFMPCANLRYELLCHVLSKRQQWSPCPFVIHQHSL